MPDLLSGLVPLLAQEVPVGYVGVSSSNVSTTIGILILVAFVLSVIFGTIILGLRHARLERELEHTERMKALEMGQVLPKDAPFWTPAKQAMAVGVAVPLGCVMVAAQASLDNPALIPFAWPMAGGIGVTAVICGTVLALMPRPGQTEAQQGGEKPRINDPDAYDTTSRRGWSDITDSVSRSRPA